MTRIGWPVVVLAAIAVAGFVAIFALIPDNEPAGRSGMLGFISLAGNAVVVWFTSQRTNELRDQVADLRRKLGGTPAEGSR